MPGIYNEGSIVSLSETQPKPFLSRYNFDLLSMWRSAILDGANPTVFGINNDEAKTLLQLSQDDLRRSAESIHAPLAVATNAVREFASPSAARPSHQQKLSVIIEHHICALRRQR